MGNDGGSIPKRRELVKEAARNPTTAELKETRTEQQGYLWSTDPISQRPLTRPVVSDYLGRLFNKDSVIEFLLPVADDGLARRAEQEEQLKRAVKSLKDVVEVKFESKAGAWICPITSKELGPGIKAVYLVPCGHAFSEAAIKEVSTVSCLQCNEPFAPNDVIPILSTMETDIARLTLRWKTLKEKGLAHSLKKNSGGGKKRKKDAPEEVVEPTAGESRDSLLLQQALKQRLKPASGSTTPLPRSGTATPTTSGIKNASTASLTAKVLLEQEERNKRRKMGENENLKSLFSSSSASDASINGQGQNKDFMSRGYSIPAHQQR